MNQKAQCEGKDKLTPQQAAKILKNMNRRRHKLSYRATSYRCKYCGYHHIGGKQQ